MAGSARDEAERLVATVLAMATGDGPGADDSSRMREQVTAGLGALAGGLRQAADRVAAIGSGQHKPSSGWATGSAECCVCPVCKAIAAARDPSPANAARLASSAGDIATGVASLMRGLSSMAGGRRKPPPRPAPPPPAPDQTWSAATRASADHPATMSPADAAATAQESGADPWAAASAAGAAAAEADRAEARARREAAEKARIAAQEAARRVAEAAALATAAKKAALAKAAKKAAEPPRGPGGLDVWAAATADAAVADPARPTALDHDVPGDEAGDEAHGGDAV